MERTGKEKKSMTRAVCGRMLLLLAAGSAVPAAAVPAYRVEDLSAYGGDGDIQATAINAAGRVSGPEQPD